MKENRRDTKQLKVIWEAIRDETSHPTADQIYENVRSAMPNISLGTVYRNLQKLVAEGKLQVLALGRTQRFDPMLKRHEHFICERCGRVYDLLVDPGKKIPAPEGFTVTSHQLALYGNCKNCSEEC